MWRLLKYRWKMLTYSLRKQDSTDDEPTFIYDHVMWNDPKDKDTS